MAPVDIFARVISNMRLSDDYNVLTLSAPEIGERTEPGQFVMVKPEGCGESLLRRPFSVFEVIRHDSRATGISILNKRAGPNTRALYRLDAWSAGRMSRTAGAAVHEQTDRRGVDGCGRRRPRALCHARRIARARAADTARCFTAHAVERSCSTWTSSNGSACVLWSPPKTARRAFAVA